MAKKRKCTHPRGYDRTGRCPICGTAKPGRPAGSTKPRPLSAGPAAASQAPAPAAALLPPLEPGADRATRIARAYPAPPPSPPVPAEPLERTDPEEEEDEEAEPGRSKDKTAIGYGWDWTARKLVTGLDMGTSIVIEHFMGRDPLDAGEEETEELQRVTAEYGEKRIGKVEAPLWLVFLIALTFFSLSKYAGAPKKEPPPKIVAKPEPAIPGKTMPAGVDTAATQTPVDAAAVAMTETPRQPPAPTAAVTGSAEGASVGY